MTHLSAHWEYIVASYALTLGCSAALAIGASLRLKRAKARYAALAPRFTDHDGRAS